MKNAIVVAVATLTGLGGAFGAARPAGQTSSTKTSLTALLEDLRTDRITVIDLSATLSARTPTIQLPPPFANTPGFESHQISNFDEKGPGWYWNWFSTGEHVGTHFDAPCHWVSGKALACVDQLEPKQFIGPAAVIDVTAEVGGNPDFVATSQTILAWERANGRVPAHAWVILRIGWSARGDDAKAFMNIGGDGVPHYPGFGKDSATFLTTQRDILGVGTEAVGTDAAVGAKADPPFPNHFIMHGAGKFGLTQLANVDRLPAVGAVVVATPLKIDRGSGSPVRVIALVPASPHG